MMRPFAILCLLLTLCTSSLGGEAPAQPLPVAKPAATAAEWHASPDVALQRAIAQADELLRIHQQLKTALTWVAWVSGGLLAVLGFAKLLPGPSGAIANLAWSFFANRLQRLSDRKAETLSQGFVQVAEIMRTFPRDAPLGQVLDKLDRKLPEEVKQAYREWERQNAPARPPTRAEVKETARIQAEAAREVVAREQHPPSAASEGGSALTPRT